MNIELPAQHINVTCLEGREEGWEGGYTTGSQENRHVIEVCNGASEEGARENAHAYLCYQTHTHFYTKEKHAMIIPIPSSEKPSVLNYAVSETC
jgi:hypothetical protein